MLLQASCDDRRDKAALAPSTTRLAHWLTSRGRLGVLAMGKLSVGEFDDSKRERLGPGDQDELTETASGIVLAQDAQALNSFISRPAQRALYPITNFWRTFGHRRNMPTARRVG